MTIPATCGQFHVMFFAGGAQQDAVGVCAQELQDPQLALFLCHMLEGPQGPLQHHLISSQLLPRKLSSSFLSPAWEVAAFLSNTKR